MRGKTYFFMAGQTATAIAATAAGAKMEPADIARRAADIVDAIYAEKTCRNAADLAAAALESDSGEGLNSLDDCLGA